MKRIYSFSSLLIVLNLLPVGLVSPASAVNTIEMKRNVLIRGENFNLSDIASLRFDNEDLLKRVQKLPVGRVPLAGQTRRISGELVRLRMAQNNINGDRMIFIVNESTLVKRESQDIDEREIRRALNEYLTKRIPRDLKGVRFRYSFPPVHKAIPEGKISYLVSPVQNLPVNWRAPFTLNVSVCVNQESVRNLPIRVQVSAYKTALVAVDTLDRGEPLNGSNVKEKLVPLKRMAAGTLRDIQSLSGYRARRVIPAGNVITRIVLERIPVIRRGDRIRLEAEIGKIAVHTRVEAITPGYYGDRILVRNLDTKRVVQAKIISPDLVRSQAEQF